MQQRRFQQLIDRISECLVQVQQHAFEQVNTLLVETYWQIGQYIVEFEQKGNERAEYGSRLLRDSQKIIKPKNMAAGYARRHVFGFYMDHFLLGVP